MKYQILFGFLKQGQNLKKLTAANIWNFRTLYGNFFNILVT